MQKDNLDRLFRMRHDVALADFDQVTLAFQAADHTLTELNATARMIVNALDGRRTLRAVAADIAARQAAPVSDVADDVAETVGYLQERRLVTPVCRQPFKKGIGTMTQNAVAYLADPDVSCRIEDDDGAILYAPESAVTQVINPIGLEIWETLSTPQTIDTLTAHLVEVCEDAPVESVREDVKAFLVRLAGNGFIGEVEAALHD